MKSMTIGKKIGWGVGILIAISAILGALAVVNMKLAQRDAHNLSAKFVPESNIAARLESSIWRVQVAARTYGLTAETNYLEEVRDGLVAVDKVAAEAKQLADANPDLVKLREGLQQLAPVLNEYRQTIAQTAAKNEDLMDCRRRLDLAATELVTNVNQLIASQEQSQDDEIKAGLDAAKLQERAFKVRVTRDLQAQASGMRLYALKAQAWRNAAYIENSLRDFEAVETNLASLAKIVRQPKNIENLNRIKSAANAYRDATKELMDDSTALTQIGKTRADLQNKLRTVAETVSEAGIKRTVQAAEDSRGMLDHSVMTITAGVLAALVAGIVIAYLIVTGTKKVLVRIAHALADGSNQVASAANQVSMASQSLAEGSSEQAASIEETSASLEEMASMTRNDSENAQKTHLLAKQARESADKGAADMQEMSSAMEAIKSSSGDIAKIIKTIDEIAFQTNILALNAAVEAARAGEAGMGFAVVADEVRNLAQRSAQAAKETAAKIEGAINKTHQGVDITNKVAGALNEIVVKSRQVDELAAQTATASNEQSQGIAQINLAMGQMDKVTQSNASTAEESAAAAEELSSQAQIMKESVSELLHLVGGAFKTAQVKTFGIKKAMTRSELNGNGIKSTRLAAPARAETPAKPRATTPEPAHSRDF